MTNLTRRSENKGPWLNPWREMEEMRRQMLRSFDGGVLTTSDWAPLVDASENDTEYRIRAALPDVKKEDVRITFEDGILAIRGERKSRKEEKGAKYHRLEIQEGSFSRSFTMPADADPDKVAAKYDDGMLDIAIGKTSTKTPGGRSIPVR